MIYNIIMQILYEIYEVIMIAKIKKLRTSLMDC